MKMANLNGQESTITEIKLEKALNMMKMEILNNNLIIQQMNQQLIGKMVSQN